MGVGVILVLSSQFPNHDWLGKETETLRAAGFVYESVSEGEEAREGRERERERERWEKDEARAPEERERILERWNNGGMKHQPDGGGERKI